MITTFGRLHYLSIKTSWKLEVDKVKIEVRGKWLNPERDRFDSLSLSITNDFPVKLLFTKLLLIIN